MEPHSSTVESPTAPPASGVAAPDLRIETSAPLAVEAVAWRPRAGEVAATIIVKATFRLEPYLSPLSDEVEPVADLDRAPFKRAPELLAVGHAHAPGKKPTRSVVARVVFGSVDKAVELWACREFDAEGDAAVVGPEQSRFSLDYREAAGGPGTENPVGIPPSARRIASIQPRAFVPRQGLPLPTAGLGPIAADWPGRARRLRTEDRSWLAALMERDAPIGFDPSFFAIAPPDQRLLEPVSAETKLELEGLHPEHDRLVTYLEKVDPVLLCEEGDVIVPELVADTLVIDAERGVGTVTWRGVLRLAASSSPRRVRLRVEVAPEVASSRPTTIVPAPAEKPHRLVDLLGFETEIPARLRRAPELSELLGGASTDGPPKLDVLRVLATAATVSMSELAAELGRSRALELPLFPIEGELTLCFDELEALAVAVAVAGRLSSSDRNLRGALELAERVLQGPVPLSAPAAGALLSQLYASASQLPFPPGFLEAQVDRGVREHRKLKRRHVLGAPHVRAEISVSGERRALYVSEAIASHLPMSASVPVVALVEARPGEDMGEAESEAFVALALGRVVRAASVRPVAA